MLPKLIAIFLTIGTIAPHPVKPAVLNIEEPVISTPTISIVTPLSDVGAPQTVSELELAPVPVPVNNAPANCGDNTYANYIYMHESGCSTTITNGLGCLGIGQACPGSKLEVVCPNLDYTCENAYFTSYANSVYGGWVGAYDHWLAFSWW